MGEPFDGALVGQLARGRRGNFVVSPASVALALVLAREGASGASAEQIDRALGPDARASAAKLMSVLADFEESLRQAQARAIPEIRQILPPLPLVIANRLFADARFPLEPAYVDATARAYRAVPEALDFAHAAEPSRARINAWVEATTHGRIQDLLAPGAIHALTRLVLVNAIYMKANWVTTFEPHRTAPAPFQIAGGARVDAQMMHGVPNASYGEHAGARCLDLPYQPRTPRLAMLVVVPDRAPLEQVEAAYAREGIAPFLAARQRHEPTILSLPRFTVALHADLMSELSAMGLRAPFSLSGDFAAISAAEPLGFGAVAHQAWIAVDEEGTEAAAATAMAFAGGGMPPPPKRTFDVDRSFLFFIHDDAGAVLFAGRVLDPTRE